MWFRRNKWKIIAPALVIAVLITAFYFGGSTPGSQGWSVDSEEPSVSTSQAPDGDESSGLDLSAGQAEPPAPVASSPDTAEEPQASPEPTDVPAVTPTPEPAPDATAEIVPETEEDPYLTAPVPEGNPLPVEPQDVTIGSTEYTCTISISCATILDNIDCCDPDKVELLPEDGWILKPITVPFYEGESVFNVLQRVCKQQKIHMEYEDIPIYNSAYIEGICNFYEFDVGELSGWMYQVNEWFPNYGCSRYQLQDGDVIGWMYTCELGDDIGGGYSAGNGRSE